MIKLNSVSIGIDSGDVTLFSDFEDDGLMWRGEGPRQSRANVSFAQAYRSIPHVQVSISMLDASTSNNIRIDVKAENITKSDFEIVFRTWADTQVARVRVAWTSMGDLHTDDGWDIY